MIAGAYVLQTFSSLEICFYDFFLMMVKFIDTPPLLQVFNTDLSIQ